VKELPLPKRPFRDSAVFHAVLSILFVIIVFATGGNLLVGIAVAGGYFLVATGYAWWRFRQRLETEEDSS